MSGVVCIFSRDGSVVEATEVEAVLERQDHRGPDGLRVWCQGPIGLGYAALDPTGAGNVVGPLVDDGGRLTMVGDLRIDNRLDLLDAFDLSPDGVHDSEIVLAAYRCWGVDAPLHLEGAFAFVIWDAVRRRVFCARDHLGQKPLTYHLSERLFVCASEAEAVPQASGVPRRFNETRIADFLVSELEGIDHTSTFFAGVERLPPAHLLVVDRDGHRLRRYWRPDVETELRLDSDEAYAEAFAEVFSRAVGSCLTNVAAPALLLSGGIDSGAIAAFAGPLAGAGEINPLTTYSFVDDEWDTSPECSCIRTLIQANGADGVTISPADVGEMNRLGRLAPLNCGEPFDGFMVTPGLLWSRAAAEGSRIVLDGVDGDVVASTAVPTVDLMRRGRVARVWREAAARRSLFPGMPHPLRVIAGGAARGLLPGRAYGFARALINPRDPVAKAIEDSLISPEFAWQVDLGSRLEQLVRAGRRVVGGGHSEAHIQEVTSPYVAAALERYDRVAARCGVDARHPFFDLRIVELCLSLPWDLKTRRGWSKFILRAATEAMVPDVVRWRHDHGDVLWRSTSRVISQERSHLDSMLRTHEDLLLRFIAPEKLDRARRALEGNPTASDEVWLWEASVLAAWMSRVGP